MYVCVRIYTCVFHMGRRGLGVNSHLSSVLHFTIIYVSGKCVYERLLGVYSLSLSIYIYTIR